MTLPEEDGVIRSQVFPGLWLDVVAMLDMPQVLSVLQSGINSAEHQAFVQRLADAQSQGLSECSDGKTRVRTLSLFEEDHLTLAKAEE